MFCYCTGILVFISLGVIGFFFPFYSIMAMSRMSCFFKMTYHAQHDHSVSLIGSELHDTRS